MSSWYTRPKNKFDSFYYYDENRRILVRIRLELNRVSREKDNGGTKAIYRENRYCCSYPNNDLRKIADFFLENGKIVAKDKQNGEVIPVSEIPVSGENIYDFSSEDGRNPDKVPHMGNKLTTTPELPDGITEIQLIFLANKAIKLKKSISLTNNAATEVDLKQAIRHAISD